jgi:hypothetical protein
MGSLSFGEKFVLVDNCGHRDFCIHKSIIDSNHLTLAAHSNALGKSNFWWKLKGELDGRAGGPGRNEIKSNTPGAHVASLRGL